MGRTVLECPQGMGATPRHSLDRVRERERFDLQVSLGIGCELDTSRISNQHQDCEETHLAVGIAPGFALSAEDIEASFATARLGLVGLSRMGAGTRARVAAVDIGTT